MIHQAIAEFVNDLDLVSAKAAEIWRLYRELGPGNVDTARFPQLDCVCNRLQAALELDVVEEVVEQLAADEAAGRTAADCATLEINLRRLREISRKCVCDPQGLCFVTGEAGLVPRTDLHTEMDRLVKAFQGYSQIYSRHVGDSDLPA